jgi:putative endonuclease
LGSGKRHSALSERSATQTWFVYILRCSNGTLYTGSTNNLAARELAHNQGRGAKYTAGRRPLRIVYSEVHESRSTAQARESQLKRWTRARKEALVAGASDRPKRL